MATPADQRLLELLDKWLQSLELHARYSSLDDDSYWKIQPWVEHQRPSRWIIDVAMQKTLALRAHVQERVKLGDAKYSDSLELMIFLANLVGSEHIERFIPVAEAQNERPLTPQPPGDAARNPADTATGTREMPKFLAAKRAPPPAGTAQVARTERKGAAPAKPAPRPVKQTTAARHGQGRSAVEACRQERTRQNCAGAAVRPRDALGCGASAGHGRCRAAGAMGTALVRIAGADRAHGGPALLARSKAYTQRE